MNKKEVLNQLHDLVEDRKSCLDGDEDHDEIFKADIEALETAIRVITYTM